MAAAAKRKAAKVEAVNPEVELREYDHATGTGVLVIDGVEYTMSLIRALTGRKIGMRLVRLGEDGEEKVYDVDFTVEPWTCDCADATYRPERPGGCKHLVALRKAGETLRCQKPAAR